MSAPFAVIDIGATFIRLSIADFDAEHAIRLLERNIQAVPLGRDIVSDHYISQETMRICVGVVQSFVRLLSEYHIEPKSVKAVATTSVRLASNSDVFFDRLMIASGISFKLMESTQVGYYNHLAFRVINDRQNMWERGNVVIMEVGGIFTNISYRRSSEIQFVQTYPVGSLAIAQQMGEHNLSSDRLEDLVKGQTREMVLHLKQSITHNQSLKLLLMGRDMRLIAAYIKKTSAPFSVDDKMRVIRFPATALEQAVKRMKGETVAQLASRFDIPYSDAEVLLPTWTVVLAVVNVLKLRDIYVSNLSLSDGLLVEAVDKPAWRNMMVRHIRRVAKEIGEHYQYDEKHAEQVRTLAMKLFDLLQQEHGCSPRERLILEVAAILHDIGMFINNRGHHKHSMYLILNADLLGFSQHEIRLISLVTRYHRKAVPSSHHVEYMTLDQEDRLIVSKLAALLRIADALDREHDQGLGKVQFELDENRLTCIPGRRIRASVEEMALVEKSNLFENIYGRKCFVKRW